MVWRDMRIQGMVNDYVEDLYHCCSDAGDVVRPCFVFLICAIVISFYMAHFRDGTSHITRYVYGVFCERMGSCCCCL